MAWSRRCRRSTVVAVGAMGAVLVVAASGLRVVAQSQAAPPARPEVIEPARIRLTPAALAALGRYPREEAFVRDLYARLMRYDFAARQIRRVETGEPVAPSAYLTIALRDIRTGPWTGEADLDATARASDVLAVHRRILCKEDDPCHVYYDLLSLTLLGGQSALASRYRGTSWAAFLKALREAAMASRRAAAPAE